MLWINNLLIVYAGLIFIVFLYRLINLKKDVRLRILRKQKKYAIFVRCIMVLLLAISVNDLFINEEWQYLFWAFFVFSFYL